MTNDKNESMSAWVDGEVDQFQQGLSLPEQMDQETWRRYHLIGDILRDETSAAAAPMQWDFSQSIAKALEQEADLVSFAAVKSAQEQTKKAQVAVEQELTAIAAKENAQVSAKVIPWRQQWSQWAVAASVAVVAVLGVQNFAGQQVEPSLNPLPVLQTSGGSGSLSPVSLSAEPSLPRVEMNMQQLQQQRVGALMLEHQRQVRNMTAVESKSDAESKQQDK